MTQDIKHELDVLDKMIDYVQRKIRSNENIISAINSNFEYETFSGIKPNERALNEVRANSEALHRMLTYRSYLMNKAVGLTAETLTLDLSGITFGDYTFQF